MKQPLTPVKVDGHVTEPDQSLLTAAQWLDRFSLLHVDGVDKSGLKITIDAMEIALRSDGSRLNTGDENRQYTLEGTSDALREALVTATNQLADEFTPELAESDIEGCNAYTTANLTTYYSQQTGMLTHMGFRTISE